MNELNGNWLLGIVKHENLRKDTEINTVDLLEKSGMTLIPGTVPGNYEIDMEREGLIGDPFFGKNLLEEHDREMNHLFYARKFDCEAEPGKKYVLRFEGIDTVSDIYINGVKKLHTDSMLVPHELEFTAEELKKGENEVLVHIIPIAIAAREYDYPFFAEFMKYEYDGMFIRKAAYMFGWDIFPRMLSGGIWKGVSFYEKPEFDFLQTYLVTTRLLEDNTMAHMEFFYELELGDAPCKGFEVEISAVCGKSSFTHRADVWSKAGKQRFEFENPVLWWPRRAGKPNLYDVTAKLLRNGETVAEKKFKTGIRTVELDKTSLTDENHSGEFCFYINGKKTFILGTNWVPLDSLPSRGKERIKPCLDMVMDLDCNMIRCWGGGYYEDDELYERCDEAGILVWQDFMEACARYPEDDFFLKRFADEVEYHVRRLRQHPCIALWSGDNENDVTSFWGPYGDILDPNDNLNTRKIVPAMLRRSDFVRPYLPSSPYVDETAFQLHEIDNFLPEQHLWGPRDYFKGEYYSKALAHFASETGYHGSNSVESIKKFISEDALWPYWDNGEWLLHASSPTDKTDEPFAYRIELMAGQIKTLFGRKAENLEEFALLSQISQAEAKKYFVERFRIGKWDRTGIIWWNLIDGCPQFSDAIVDYYFDKKLAYDYIKRSQQMIALMCDEPDELGQCKLVAVNDYRDEKRITYKVTDVTTGKVVSKGSALLSEDSATVLAILDSRDRQAFFRLDWTSEGETGSNHFVTWPIPFDKEKYIVCAKAAGCKIK